MYTIANKPKSNKKSENISILIVEDQELLRVALKLTLSNIEGFEIVGEARDGREAVDSAISMAPTVIIMDINLPNMDGIQASLKIKEKTDCKILVLSGHDEDDFLFPALEAGVDGYCLKGVSDQALKSAVIAVANGGTWLDSLVAQKVLKQGKPADRNSLHSHSNKLTEREIDILTALLAGKSTDIIAGEFSIPSNEVHELTKSVLVKSASSSNLALESSEKKLPHRRITYEHELSKKCSFCNIKVPLSAESCPSDGKPVIFDPLIGAEFANRYEILSLLGSGAGGAVYKAKHKFMEKLVAIKILHSNLMDNLELLQRFRQEAAMACHLNHPNIVSVLDFGLSDEGTAFMIMDYIDSDPLDAILKKSKFIEPKIAVEIFKQVSAGMHHAHESGILHRDLKPSNILVSDLGEADMLIKIADFGTAKIIKDSKFTVNSFVNTEVGQFFGTPLYMSPEQCQTMPTSKASDIYSMGCLMFYVLTGNPPFTGEDVVDVMYKHIYCNPLNFEELNLKFEIPPLLQKIIMKALNKKPDDRFNSMNELKFHLEGVSFKS